jgi:hypothetical protein
MKVAPTLPQLGAMTIDLTVGQNAAAKSALEIIRYKMADQNANQPSLTEQMSRDFAMNYLNLSKNGNWNSDSQAELIQNLVDNYATTTSTQLTLQDVLTFSDRETEKTKQFGNNTAKTVINYYPQLKTSPVDILSDAMNNKAATSTTASQLATISHAYRSIALDLQKIPAPVSLAAEYLDVINGYIKLADDVDNMRASFDDSVRGFVGLSNFQKDGEAQANLLKNITTYFASNGILFTSTEEGRIWNSLI